MATMLISLIKIFRLGPEVSLNGSPTVSPTTVALCTSCLLYTSNDKVKGLYEKEEKLVLEYIDKQYKNKQSEQDMDRNFISMEQKTGHKKDSILARLYDVPDPLLWQIAKVRNLGFSLQNIKTRSIAREYVDSIKQKLTHPQLAEEAERCV